MTEKNYEKIVDDTDDSWVIDDGTKNRRSVTNAVKCMGIDKTVRLPGKNKAI